MNAKGMGITAEACTKVAGINFTRKEIMYIEDIFGVMFLW